MTKTYEMIQLIVDFIFGIPAVYTLLGIGTFFTFYLLFPQLRFFWHAIRILAGRYSKLKDFDDEPSIVKSFSTAIAAPIGLGSIAGAAIAISIGGPGAIFWMLIAGVLGMATKLVSLSSSLSFGVEDKVTGQMLRGPMYLIENKLPTRFKFLSKVFAALTIVAALFAGNLFQGNQMFAVVDNFLPQVPHLPLILGGLITLITGLAVFKFKSIERVVSYFAPIMMLLYLIGGIGIVFSYYHYIPTVFFHIYNDAFAFNAAGGGVIGLGFREIITHGARRALFSNEAGLGTNALSPRPQEINPIQHGIAAMLGSFIDTVFTCLLTALIILCPGSWDGSLSIQGVELAANSFAAMYGIYGKIGISVFVWLFAFSTIMTWYSNGKAGLKYLTGEESKKAELSYKTIFVLITFFGPLNPLILILNFSDAIFAMMLGINLLASLYMVKEIRKKLKKYCKDIKAERI
ncbi:MAG: sodium:alanine symporter family protein [Bacteriovoracaceae bacterium]|nr:sodium:alanine symporter family protein [Bacteriovoracaceae bacterium]